LVYKFYYDELSASIHTKGDTVSGLLLELQLQKNSTLLKSKEDKFDHKYKLGISTAQIVILYYLDLYGGHDAVVFDIYDTNHLFLLTLHVVDTYERTIHKMAQALLEQKTNKYYQAVKSLKL
jgi:hypothetical protein|tara:strand:+ start:253 stop:618 length:366 start_codon:yes stop_codon:yes gene_type:complete